MCGKIAFCVHACLPWVHASDEEEAEELGAIITHDAEQDPLNLIWDAFWSAFCPFAILVPDLLM